MLFGDGSNAAKAAADAAKLAVRSTDNFNWTFITLLAFVAIIYVFAIKQKRYNAVFAALALYSVHWFYEIMNAVICYATGYALWTVSAESTSYILLIGVSWELSMMFSVAGFTCLILPEDKKKKILGIPNRIAFAIGAAAMFSVIEIFLAGTPAFIWVYEWWGAIPVFVTTYIPFFLACYLIYDAKRSTQILFVTGLSLINIIMLIVMVPLGII